MLTRTAIRVLLSLALLGWSAARFLPVAATNREVAIRSGAVLIAVGAVVVVLRLFARGWLDAQSLRGRAVFGYAAPAWVHDASGLVLMLAGLCLVAWWAA